MNIYANKKEVIRDGKKKDSDGEKQLPKYRIYNDRPGLKGCVRFINLTGKKILSALIL